MKFQPKLFLTFYANQVYIVLMLSAQTNFVYISQKWVVGYVLLLHATSFFSLCIKQAKRLDATVDFVSV